MKLLFNWCIWIFILISIELCRSHRSLNKHNHGRYLSMNSSSRHRKIQDSLTRRKRSESYSKANVRRNVKSTTIAEDMSNSTSPGITQSVKINVQPLNELANIFGNPEKVSNSPNFNELLDNQSSGSHTRIKRDNPDFNEVIKPISEELIEINSKNTFNPKSYLNDDYSILKNHFDDIYPETSGLIDYDKPLISGAKAKRETKKESIQLAVRKKNSPEIRNLHETRRESPHENSQFFDNESIGKKFNFKIQQTRSIEEAKQLATKLVAKVNEIEDMMSGSLLNKTEIIKNSLISKRIVHDAARNLGANRMKNAKKHRRRKTHHRKKRKSRRKWERWSDWSSCSVTCGRGRQIRWRHCIHSCTTAETEMEEKMCQLPACAPGKFLGIF